MLRDPLYGYDLQEALSMSGTAATILATVCAKVRAQLLRDERIADVVFATKALDATTKTMTLGIDCTTAAGPFDLVFSLSPAGINVIIGTN